MGVKDKIKGISSNFKPTPVLIKSDLENLKQALNLVGTQNW